MREQTTFRKDLGTFLRLYDFLSQIVPYNDPELEKLYAFGKNLLPRLIVRRDGGGIDIEDDVRLTHYRLQKLGERQLDLEKGEALALKPVSEAGSGEAREDETKRLSEIVARMNDLFSGNLTEADLLGYATHIRSRLLENERLEEQATHNSLEQFAMGDFDHEFMDAVIDGLNHYKNMAGQVLSNERVKENFKTLVMKWVYDGFTQSKARPRDPSSLSSL